MSVQEIPTMPFGKYRGRPLAELPDEYLLWLSLLDDRREPLLQQVLQEMGRRMEEEPLNRGATAVEPRYQSEGHRERG